MRFFVRMKERPCADPQERAAMLKHRLNAIEYQFRLLHEERLHYAFYTNELTESILLYVPDNLEQLDYCIKRDPHFAYSVATVLPCIDTEALVREAQDYLREDIIPEERLAGLTPPKRPIDPDSEYWLAWKQVQAFSPLLPLEDQDDVHRRTVVAQSHHAATIEFADDNPVGMPVGILIAEGAFSDVRRHVEDCEVYPDTSVTYTQLLTLQCAWDRTRLDLLSMRRSAPESRLLGAATDNAKQR
jgi:hypothetical protein